MTQTTNHREQAKVAFLVQSFDWQIPRLDLAFESGYAAALILADELAAALEYCVGSESDRSDRLSRIAGTEALTHYHQARPTT